MRVLIYTALGVIVIFTYLLLFPKGTGCVLSAEAAMARNDVVILSSALTAYKLEYGNYPKGTDPEVINQLAGENPKKIAFIEVDSRKMSPDGIFLDPWKRPYQINPIDDPEEASCLVARKKWDR